MAAPPSRLPPFRRRPAIDLRQVARGTPGSTRLGPDGRTLWWATHTPDGPGTLRVELVGAGHRGRAWGPGADWILEQAPGLIGARDEPEHFDPPEGEVRRLWQRQGGYLLGRTDRVFEAVLEGVLCQKVQTASAKRSLRRLVAAHGEAAPGPVPLRLGPRPDRLAELSSAELHRFGIERKRADTIRRAAAHALRLEAAGREGSAALQARLLAITGIGPWTAALARSAALGDPDAVPVGDFHLVHAVCWALAGEARGTDARMLQLLEPYRGQRGRVVALLYGAHGAAPRFGPRLELLAVDHYDRAGVVLRDRGPRARRPVRSR